MIVTERTKVTIATRDACPQPGDVVFRQNGERTEINIPIAHFPGFVVNHNPKSESMGCWEVRVPGIRKPSVLILVYWGGQIEGGKSLWYEVPKR